MKKFFGVLCLLIGLFCVTIGVAAIASIETQKKSFDGQVQEEFIDQYKSNQEKDQIVAGAIAIVGVVFFISGIVLLVTKTKKQRLMEAELKLLKSNSSTLNQSVSNEDSISKLEKLGTLKEKGVITETEFENEKKKIFGYF